MFDKTFFKFALGFTVIIAVSMLSLVIAGHMKNKIDGGQSAAVVNFDK